jgi:hypothetical protein
MKTYTEYRALMLGIDTIDQFVREWDLEAEEYTLTNWVLGHEAIALDDLGIDCEATEAARAEYRPRFVGELMAACDWRDYLDTILVGDTIASLAAAVSPGDEATLEVTFGSMEGDVTVPPATRAMWAGREYRARAVHAVMECARKRAAN